MNKTTLTLALATALFTSMSLLNCSKKEDPAPAPATTTSGTTTSGTTTSGTTTSGTTTSGTTTSGTTTSGTTTSSTTSGSTTSKPSIGGSGTFVIDGKTQSPTSYTYMYATGGTSIRIIAQNDEYAFQISIKTALLQDGSYAIGKGVFFYSGMEAWVAVVPVKGSGAYHGVVGGDVVVSGKKITIILANLTEANDETKKMSASCNITLD